MPKTKISEFSSTPANNTDIDSINIAEGCAPSGINDAIRELMAQLKDFQTGAVGDSFNGPVGTTTPAAGAFTTLSATGNVTLGDASTDTLNVGNGGLIKDASGNLGLGVTPSAWTSAFKAFQIGSTGSLSHNGTADTYLANNYASIGGSSKYITTAASTLYQQTGGQHAWYNAPSGTAGNAISFTQAMTLDASGNLGIGTTSPSYRVHASGGAIRADLGSAGTSLILTGTGSNFQVDHSVSGYATLLNSGGGLAFSANGSERARIDTSGNLLVGTTADTSTNATGATFAAATNGRRILRLGATTTSSSNVAEFYNTNGNVGAIVISGTTTNFATSSDYRLKNITGELTGYKDRIMSLQPKQGTWKIDGSEFRGFLAHEFAQPYSSSVSGEKDAVDDEGKPVMQAMQASSSEVMADLVALVQEQQALIDSLKARLDAANL